MEKRIDDVLSNLRNRFQDAPDTDGLKKFIGNMLPLQDFLISQVNGCNKRFIGKIYTNFRSEEEITDFIVNYNDRNNETLRLFGNNGENNEFLFRRYYRCQHFTRNERTKDSHLVLSAKPFKRLKNTNCPFKLAIKTKHNSYIDNYNTLIELSWDHNHPIQSLHALSFKDMSPDVVNQVKDSFKKGLLPGSAYKEFLKQLRSECSSDLEYHKRMADRSLVPRRNDFNYLYGQFTKENFGTGSLSAMYQRLDEKISDLSNDVDWILKCQKFDEDTNTPFILIIISPLMKRVHLSVSSSKDIMFMDSSSNMEEFNLRVFMLVTSSVVGALPLGIVITSDEQTDTLRSALQMFKDALPDGAFFGSGSGPAVIMTDNCDELRSALNETWPRSTLLLCIFHILQQVWRWLHDKKNGINIAHRPELLVLFKQILFEDDEVEDLIDSFLADERVTAYPNFIKYMESVFMDKESWALSYRKELPTHGNNTNNFCEAQFMVIKDDILGRQKEVNIVGLLEKLTRDLENHYKNKLLSCSSGKFDGVYPRFKSFRKKTNMGDFQIPSLEEQEFMIDHTEDLGQNTFIVPSLSNATTKYVVDMSSGICECFVGSNGAPCKHQFILWAKRRSLSGNFIPVNDPQKRKALAELAIGETLDIPMYEGLHDRLISREAIDSIIDDETINLQSVGNESSDDVEPPKKRLRTIDIITKDEAEEAISDSMKFLLSAVNEDNQSLMRGILKFKDRLELFQSTSRLESALHSFGATFKSSKKVATRSVLKKCKRGKIHVQPSSVSRRINKNGSKTKLHKGQTKKNPFEKQCSSTKRVHLISKNIANNENVPKKAGRTMISKSRTGRPKQTEK